MHLLDMTMRDFHKLSLVRKRTFLGLQDLLQLFFDQGIYHFWLDLLVQISRESTANHLHHTRFRTSSLLGLFFRIKFSLRASRDAGDRAVLGGRLEIHIRVQARRSPADNGSSLVMAVELSADRVLRGTSSMLPSAPFSTMTGRGV